MFQPFCILYLSYLHISYSFSGFGILFFILSFLVFFSPNLRMFKARVVPFGSLDSVEKLWVKLFKIDFSNLHILKLNIFFESLLNDSLENISVKVFYFSLLKVCKDLFELFIKLISNLLIFRMHQLDHISFLCIRVIT